MGKSAERVLESAFARYRLVRQIGEGGAGHVWAAVDDAEIRFCERNKHKSIVTVTDHGTTVVSGATVPFYVMPILSGSLRGLMASKSPTTDRLRYFRQILDGVEAAHLLGVVHRDLKPENILHDGASAALLIADFGIAHFSDEELFTAVETKSAERLANFHYAAPEQKARGSRVDHRADIFALGLILNELFTASVPQGTGYRTIASAAPEYGWMDAIVDRMIRQDPSERPPDIEAVRHLLAVHEAQFATRQRLSEIGDIAIPEGEEDDPLAIEPPKVVDFDWRAGRLTLVLDRRVSEDWHRNGFLRMAHRYTLGRPPSRFTVKDNRASVDCPDSQVQSVIDMFKEWLPVATRAFRDYRSTQRAKAAEERRRALANEREELDRQQRLRANIRL